MKKTRLTPQLLILMTVSLGACLSPTDLPREPNVFSLSITIPDAGQDYVVGNDTLTVVGYKMLIDTISVRKQGETDERFAPKLLLASYVPGFADYSLVGGGFVGEGTFNGIRYSVIKPSLFISDFSDPDLIERDEATGRVIDTYSISVVGIYKGSLFRFRSKVSRTVQYDFLTSVPLPEFNGYLEARLRGNWKQWFLNPEGNGILDPGDSRNRERIEGNLLQYFDILTFSAGEALQ